MGRAFVTASLLVLLFTRVAPAQDVNEELWAAARKGDAKEIEALLAKGADVNAKTAYGVTALHFAADKGHLDAVKVLLKHKASVNVKDTFYSSTPLSRSRGYWDVVLELIMAGADGASNMLVGATKNGQTKVVEAILARTKVPEATLNAALAVVPAKNPEIAEALKKAGAKIVAKTNIAPAKPACDREARNAQALCRRLQG